MIKVKNFTSNSGNSVPNQFMIFTGEKTAFQSYNTVIAILDEKTRQVTLDEKAWDCSVTTSKYRNHFLGETKKETLAKIKSGEYLLGDLN